METTNVKEKKTFKKSEDTLDIVEQANYSTVSEEYNKAFKAWRNQKNNDYAFRCRKKQKETVYIEGKGYHSPNPAAEERRAMIRINLILGMGIFCYLLIENLLAAILMGIAQLAGLDVGYCYSDGTVFGNQTAVLIILMLKTILKFLVPILIFRFTFHLPRRVAYHIKIDVLHEFPTTIGVTLIVFSVANIWLAFSPINFLSLSTLGEAYYAVSYMQPSYQIFYLAFELLMVCILNELLIHGEALHVLRQFGDWYAIVITALLAVCISHSYVTILMELTFSIITGISVLRSGSLLPSMVCRILYHLLLFAMFTLEIRSDRSHDYRLLLMLLIFAAGVLLCLIFIRPRRNYPGLVTQKHYLTLRERIKTIFHLGPLMIIFCLCIILMIIEVIF